MFRKINLFAVLFLLPLCSLSQDFDQDMKMIVAHFDSAASVSIKVKVNAFDKKGGKLIYASNCQLERKGKSTYSKLDNLENIVSGGYNIVVDNTEKSMVVSKSKKISNTDLDISSLKKLLKSDNKGPKIKTALTSEKGGIRSYTLTGVDQLDEVVLDLDIANKSIRKITYLYSKESGMSSKYIVLDYSQFSTNSSNFAFNLKDYFTLSNGKYVINTKYKHYKLITE